MALSSRSPARSGPRPRPRLLALDVDGTLTDPEGRITPRVAAAVARVRDSGIQVVLCTGRRYRTTAPLLQSLGLAEGPVVVHNGVVVKDAASGETLAHRYLEAELYARALAILRQAASPMLYVDHFPCSPPSSSVQREPEAIDILHEAGDRAHAFQAEYLHDNRAVAQQVDSLDAPGSRALVMLSCMADEASLRPLQREIEAQLAAHTRTHFLINKNYRGFILEVVSAAAGKWPALRALAEAEGIEPAEIVAVGDDENDAEMLAAAGLGIAMDNAKPSVKQAADVVTASNAQDGLAVAIERWVLGGSPPSTGKP